MDGLSLLGWLVGLPVLALTVWLAPFVDARVDAECARTDRELDEAGV